jgi:hypothetical protein
MSQENGVKNVSPSRPTAEQHKKRIDCNNINGKDIKTELIRPRTTYASVLILNAVCVHFFTAFSPLK